jgi:DNA-binding IclR family transcriptional regulator
MPKKAAHLSHADANPAPGGVAAVDRALSVLAAFEPGDVAVSLQQLSDRTLLYKSAVLRLLASLEHGGLVRRRADGHYMLGSSIARLHSIYANAFSPGDLVMPVLRELVEQTGESAAYHVVQGAQRVCLHRVDSPHPLRFHIREGDILPLDKGAGGRVLSAFLGVRGKIYDTIRRDGFVVMTGDRIPEVSGVSAAVFEVGGRLAGTVTLTMPTSRMKPDFARAVRAAAATLTQQFGGQAPFVQPRD